MPVPMAPSCGDFRKVREYFRWFCSEIIRFVCAVLHPQIVEYRWESVTSPVRYRSGRGCDDSDDGRWPEVRLERRLRGKDFPLLILPGQIDGSQSWRLQIVRYSCTIPNRIRWSARESDVNCLCLRCKTAKNGLHYVARPTIENLSKTGNEIKMCKTSKKQKQ